VSRIGVVGAGYVGLTTAACFAHLGHEVCCADSDAARIEALSKARIHILEDGLADLVAEGIAGGRLRFVLGAAAAARDAEYVFLCVPTPQGDNGAADLSTIEAVAREVAPVLRQHAVVVNKSTAPVGSTRLVARFLTEAGAPSDVGVAANPEFLREGSAVRDFLEPSRVVIGCEDTAVAVRISELYEGVKTPIVVTDPASAEMVKYASNAFLSTKISFVNAIANLCEAVGADVREVTLGMGFDARIGFEFLRPGPGFGGSCLPKDTAALLHTAESAGYDFSLLRGDIEVNREQHERIVDKIRSAVGGDLTDARVAAWGLTFKANTDDLRASPALAIVERLLCEGASVVAYDPVASDAAASALSALEIAGDPYAACKGAGVLAVLTEWDEFRWLDFDRIADVMETPRVVDARNLLDPASMRRRGFEYQGVGR